MKGKKKTLILLGIIAILTAMCMYFLNLYANYIQIYEIGSAFTRIFWIDFNMNVIVQLAVFIFIFVLVFINWIIIRGNIASIDQNRATMNKIFPIIMGSFLIAFALAGTFGHSLAEKYLLFANSEWFNLGDPIFHQDVGYYVFQRPFMLAITDAIVGIMQFLIFFNVIAYILLYMRADQKLKNIKNERNIITHVIISIILFFLARATTYKFQAEQILTEQGREFVGAGYTAIKVWLTYYNIAPYLLLAVVISTILLVTRFKIRAAVATIAVYPAVWVVTALLAAVVQAFIVLPNEAMKELPYISNNIEFTRAAYNLNGSNMIEENFEIDYDITVSDIMQNMGVVSNIRVTDYNQNLRTLNQIQNIRNYYQFVNADISAYELNGQKTAVYLSAREMNQMNLDVSAKNYINTRMKYTHGLGVVMNPVSAITSEGQPYTIIKDIPTRSIDGAPLVNQPRVYFGETTNDYVIVGTKDGELDDIEGDGYQYAGQAGIQLNFANRLLFAARYTDLNMLISSQVQSESRLLTNRNVVKRAKMALPFLEIDSDAHITVDDNGGLKWILDGYTTTAEFPYAEFEGNFNYIRNSVKIVVDAYEGTVKAYIIDKNDPVVKAYARMYPGVFERDDLPAAQALHMRYPEWLFTIQADMLCKYHITDPTEFYQRNGMWAIANEKTDDKKTQPVQAYYSLVNIDKGEEMVAMIPFTLVNKENLAAWLAVRCEGEYGQLVSYVFPSGQNIYGTYQIENKIDTDPNISRDLTLWGQGGSQVVRGNMLVVPIKNSLIYVEPVYLTSGDKGISEVKGVVVAYGDQVVMEPTLEKALATLFGVNEPKYEENEGIKSAIEKTVQSFGKYKAAQQQADWEAAGSALKDLDDNMRELEAYAGEL
ncbi:MAG: UPF0182 family protein [Clostridiales bacterium]|jgi:uncharacterized membrane protein (UPF0182 family)|nr:UPF0182 family protein [Clostridiales bacterium]